MKTRELRTVAATELRSFTEDGKTYLEGYAARYNTPTVIGGMFWSFTEVIAPGAFKRAVAEKQDVRHLINHEPSLLLGRTKSGTTELSEDDNGLKFRTLLPDTQLARDLVVSIARGDINECSFAFNVPKGGDEWKEGADGQDDERTLKDLDLFDVSTVTFPAYPGTNTHLAMRSMPDDMRAKYQRADMPNNTGDDSGCDCACPYCEQDRCEYCCNEYCRDEDCIHDYPPNHDRHVALAPETRDKGKTKSVAGHDLPSSAFLIVGDKDDPSTWHLPVEFPTEEETVNHIKNALSRFDQVKGATDEQKKEAWAKLERLAEEHGIKVSDEDKEKHRAVDPAIQAALEAKAALFHAEHRLRVLQAGF